MAQPRRYGLVGGILATLIGVLIWGGGFAVLGAVTQQAVKGAIAGSALGAVIGCGFAKGRIGWIVPCMSAFAFAGAMVGPGCDADALSSALAGAAIGAFIGATGLRGVLAIVGGLLGVNVGAVSGGAGMLLGLLGGAGIGWWIACSLSNRSDGRQVRVSEGKASDSD